MVLIRSTKPNSRGEFEYIAFYNAEQEIVDFTKNREKAAIFSIIESTEFFNRFWGIDAPNSGWQIINATEQDLVKHG